jgi:hypothetical protein
MNALILTLSCRKMKWVGKPGCDLWLSLSAVIASEWHYDIAWQPYREPLWPSFGGHWVEIWLLTWLRPGISAARPAQVAARLWVWFVAASSLTIGKDLTVRVLAGFQLIRWSASWRGGLAFSAVEMMAHLT